MQKKRSRLSAAAQATDERAHCTPLYFIPKTSTLNGRDFIIRMLYRICMHVLLTVKM